MHVHARQARLLLAGGGGGGGGVMLIHLTVMKCRGRISQRPVGCGLSPEIILGQYGTVFRPEALTIHNTTSLISLSPQSTILRALYWH